MTAAPAAPPATPLIEQPPAEEAFKWCFHRQLRPASPARRERGGFCNTGAPPRPAEPEPTGTARLRRRDNAGPRFKRAERGPQKSESHRLINHGLLSAPQGPTLRRRARASTFPLAAGKPGNTYGSPRPIQASTHHTRSANNIKTLDQPTCFLKARPPPGRRSERYWVTAAHLGREDRQRAQTRSGRGQHSVGGRAGDSSRPQARPTRPAICDSIAAPRERARSTQARVPACAREDEMGKEIDA